jgi:hypothetical protein
MNPELQLIMEDLYKVFTTQIPTVQKETGPKKSRLLNKKMRYLNKALMVLAYHAAKIRYKAFQNHVQNKYDVNNTQIKKYLAMLLPLSFAFKMLGIQTTIKNDFQEKSDFTLGEPNARNPFGFTNFIIKNGKNGLGKEQIYIKAVLPNFASNNLDAYTPFEKIYIKSHNQQQDNKQFVDRHINLVVDSIKKNISF